MIQFALSFTDGEVFGFVYSDRMPDLPRGQIAHVMVDRVMGFPRMAAPTTKLYITNGELQKVGPDELDALKREAIDAVDAAGEALRLAVINRMPTQTEEYRQALAQAQAWSAAGYPEAEESPAPSDVTSWAMARWRDGWTARQAADDILSTASTWAAILSEIRLLRLLNKQDVLHAATPEEVAAICSDMDADMLAIAQGLGLSLT